MDDRKESLYPSSQDRVKVYALPFPDSKESCGIIRKSAPWLSVPQFGDWDQKGGVMPDYSMDFSKIRENRKQNKRDLSRASLGNEEELISSTNRNANTVHSAHSDDLNYHQNHSPTTRRSIFSYFNCCVKA